MTASRGSRARRSDAGSVRVSERDVTVLRWLGEMFGAPLSVVGALYGVGERDVRRHCGRLERAGFASRQAAPSGVWLVPTRRGLRFAGLDYDTWALVAWKSQHVAAAGRLRLALAAAYPEAAWTSERAIRSRWANTGARVRFADGQLDFPGGPCVGIELELHPKQRHEYDGIVADVDPAFDAVWWLARPSNVAWLRRVLDAIPKPERPAHEVFALTGDLAAVLG
jgi:hypothetical protein